uniref:Uncharacterized protein n=1 Tax=Muribaculaceae bacterium Z82 TaxID=2304548 RepID=A0A7C9NRT7_9BACT
MARSGFDAPSNAPVREPSADAASAGGRPAATSALGNRRSILLLVALVSVVSSSLFLHETGNRLLAEGTLLGFAVNARAVSCLANITGITAGFAVSTRCAASFSSLRRNRWFWVGFLHVIPLGLPVFQLPRVLPNLIGAAVAMALFVITVPRSEPSTVLVWNRIYRISFPFVVLAALLVPYTSADEYVSSLSFVESAQFFFVALLIIGCFVVCRTTGVGYT